MRRRGVLKALQRLYHHGSLDHPLTDFPHDGSSLLGDRNDLGPVSPIGERIAYRQTVQLVR